jgi:hypothetical protein
MIIKNIKKDNYIVDESSIIIAIGFQRPVYKTLYIRRRVCESYKDYLRTLYSSLIDKDESIAIIKMYRQLKEEVGYIDHYNISLSIDRIDNILLKR